MFQKAVKTQSRLRMGMAGPSGSGKTFTALAIGTALLSTGMRLAVIDTERGSASKYSDRWDFDVAELAHHHPQEYIKAIDAAAQAGYGVLVIDSLSHAWAGRDGALELVDKAAKRSQSNNSFAAWRDVTPLYNQLIDAILQAPLHVICTFRAKTEYVLERDERTGKTMPRKMGMAPIFRDNVDFEFDVYGDLDQDNTLVIGKTRCPALAGGVFAKPGLQVAETLLAWLNDGEAAQAPVAPPAPAAAAGKVTREELWGRYRALADEILALHQSGLVTVPDEIGALCKYPTDTPTPDLIAAGKRLRAWHDGLNGKGQG